MVYILRKKIKKSETKTLQTKLFANTLIFNSPPPTHPTPPKKKRERKKKEQQQQNNNNNNSNNKTKHTHSTTTPPPPPTPLSSNTMSLGTCFSLTHQKLSSTRARRCNNTLTPKGPGMRLLKWKRNKTEVLGNCFVEEPTCVLICTQTPIVLSELFSLAGLA